MMHLTLLKKVSVLLVLLCILRIIQFLPYYHWHKSVDQYLLLGFRSPLSKIDDNMSKRPFAHKIVVNMIVATEKLANPVDDVIARAVSQALQDLLLNLEFVHDFHVNTMTIQHLGIESFLLRQYISQSDLSMFLTKDSVSLWNQVHDPQCTAQSDCEEWPFIVFLFTENNYTSPIAVCGSESCSHNLVSAEYRASFVAVNRPVNDRAQLRTQLAHVIVTQSDHMRTLLRLDDLPSGFDTSVVHLSGGCGLPPCLCFAGILSHLSDQIEALHAQAVHTLSVAYSVRVRRNALVVMEVLLNACWVQQFKGAVDELRRVEALSAGEGIKSKEWTKGTLLEMYHAVRRLKNRADELNSEELLHHWSEASLRPLCEQCFAIFAPFWLPLFIPLFKVFKKI